MGLMDRIRGEFIDIIEWTDDGRDTIVWRFPRHGNEIKMGARLVVRESQVAVFVNEGRLADVYQPGTYSLTTQNMPVLSTLKGWKHGFESPFKAEVYFVTTRQFTDFKWGTQNPVILRDADFGMVRVRAFGTFAAKVVDAAALLRELVGTDPQFRTEEVGEHLRQLIVSKLGSALGSSGVPLLDLAARQDGIGQQLAQALTLELSSTGIAIPRFYIENISVPPEIEAAIDTRSRMTITGNLDDYAKLQAADAAFGDGALAAVAREDLADAAAIVAASPAGRSGHIYDLVGTPITAGQVADRLGVSHRAIGLGEYRRRLLDATPGLLAFQPPMLASIATGIRHGFLDGTAPDLTDLLGRPARDPLVTAVAAASATRPGASA
ncbi:SPFH domain-containing protein [Streptomyces sp. NPDC049099]|uniref:SPFH domain-containing protein n=1 Tax=Streptomyces sp. NPDC049099 TaxID=3155768 RepID=UPI00343989EA